MKKPDLVNIVAQKAHLTKKAARESIDVFLGEIRKAISKGDKVVLSGFGTFKSGIYGDKMVQYPGTKEKHLIKKHRVVRFVSGRELRKSVK